MSAITDDELFALAMVLAELLASIQMRFDADAAKIAERDAEIARLKVEREDRREDKREMRDEIAKLRAVAVGTAGGASLHLRGQAREQIGAAYHDGQTETRR